jgi:hypothetical protein
MVVGCPRSVNRKPHLLVTWLNLLIRDARILDPVADILGPDILCWGSGFFIKNPQIRARHLAPGLDLLGSLPTQIL